ncbi:MAG: HD domain-containing protein [Planctomycetia bacterium]|nr:HD domain-containing protein [Planctomycetia bacterium]
MGVELTERYAKALEWICEIHATQRRKMHQDPYVGHLLRVGGMVLEWAESEDEAIAALLHDAAEDCGGQEMLDAIASKLGATVAEYVLGCSDSLVGDPSSKAPWKERKLHHIARAKTAPLAVRRIMLCDKIDNARSILAERRILGNAIFEKFQGGKEILWYFQQMFEVLSDGTPRQLSDELQRIVKELSCETF